MWCSNYVKSKWILTHPQPGQVIQGFQAITGEHSNNQLHLPAHYQEVAWELAATPGEGACEDVRVRVCAVSVWVHEFEWGVCAGEHHTWWECVCVCACIHVCVYIMWDCVCRCEGAGVWSWEQWEVHPLQVSHQLSPQQVRQADTTVTIVNHLCKNWNLIDIHVIIRQLIFPVLCNV